MKLYVKYKHLRLSLFCSISFALFVVKTATKKTPTEEFFDRQNIILLKRVLKQTKKSHKHLEILQVETNNVKVVLRL